MVLVTEKRRQGEPKQKRINRLEFIWIRAYNQGLGLSFAGNFASTLSNLLILTKTTVPCNLLGHGCFLFLLFRCNGHGIGCHYIPIFYEEGTKTARAFKLEDKEGLKRKLSKFAGQVATVNRCLLSKLRCNFSRDLTILIKRI